jgi:hypothetical protein
MNPQHLRQVDAALLMPKLVAMAGGFFAWEMGVDPVRAAQVPWNRFSDKNRFHALASDARAMAVYLVSTGLDVPVGEMAKLSGFEKQQVSRWISRVEDMRSNRHTQMILERAEKIIGVVS